MNMKSAVERALRAVPEGSHVRSLRLYGSRLRGDNRPDSDYDFIIEMDQVVGLLAFIGIQQALEDALGAKVDLCTPENVHPVLKKKVLSTAQIFYEGAAV